MTKTRLKSCRLRRRFDTPPIHYLDLDASVQGCQDAYEGALGQTYQCKYVQGGGAFERLSSSYPRPPQRYATMMKEVVVEAGGIVSGWQQETLSVWCKWRLCGGRTVLWGG